VNGDSFNALYDHTARDLFGYLLRRTHSPEDAADCLAETFLIAWRKREQIPTDEGHARPWMFGVARNVLRRERELDHRSFLAVAELARELLDSHTTAPADSPTTDALAKLSPTDREIIEMLAWDQLSPREVATILNLSANVVRIRSHRARLKLREHVQATTQTESARAAE
jgi:RNA polymerase sigma-70 factor (ECF subfamily)